MKGRGIIKLFSVFVVIAAGLYFNFFGLTGKMKQASAKLEKRMMSGDWSYIYFKMDDAGSDWIEYVHDEGVYRVYKDGELDREIPKDTVPFDKIYRDISSAMEVANKSDTTGIDKVTIIEGETLSVDGYEFSGQWYKVVIFSGCQTARCKMRGISSNEKYEVYIKTDGQGYISSSGGVYIVK